MTDTVRLTGPTQRDFAKRLIDAAGDGYVVRIGKETRSEEQNRKLHGMLADIQRQVEETRQFSIQDMKLRFMHELRNEMRFLPDIDGEGQFLVGQKTSTLNKEQFSDLIEIIYAWGARHDVVWSDPAERRAA